MDVVSSCRCLGDECKENQLNIKKAPHPLNPNLDPFTDQIQRLILPCYSILISQPGLNLFLSHS